MQWFFLFFVISGFCSLVYQVVWLRVAMANFGVTTTSVSIFLSIFMAGMALGSWGGGRLTRRFRSASAAVPLRLYGAAEAAIGLSGVVVAPLLGACHEVSFKAGGSGYLNYLLSAILLFLLLTPFCACMGATFPLALAAAKGWRRDRAGSSFSYLYVANVFGAMLGALSAAFVMIELLGFRGTMLSAAALNMLVAVLAFTLSTRRRAMAEPDTGRQRGDVSLAHDRGRELYLLLFLTGLASLAMEVVWVRLFVPLFGPVVYTFAAILAVYLLTTCAGSQLYRFCARRGFTLTDAVLKNLLPLAVLAALLPLLASDIRLPHGGGVTIGIACLFIGIGPFCALLGFITPALLERTASGDPERIGSGFALNMLGCIIGPIVAGFLLLPFIGERWSLVTLAILLLSVCIPLSRKNPDAATPAFFPRRLVPAVLAAALLIILLTKDMESVLSNSVLLRDHTATVVATGEGMDKLLLVNGYGMTSLTPITKMMVHLPMALHEGEVNKGLVLCFGMGTSYRSMLTWGTAATVVELVPSVPKLVPYYHADGNAVREAPNGRIVIDDARRFLERTEELFDVIVVDPPPPVEAAASSLLYSTEFYTVVKKRLAPGGTFQQWFPFGANGGCDNPYVIASMMKSIAASFPHVLVYNSFDDYGVHILASMSRIAELSPEELAARLPQKAAADLIEWGPNATPAEQFREILQKGEQVERFIAAAPVAPPLTDDRPVNEYFFMRQFFNSGN